MNQITSLSIAGFELDEILNANKPIRESTMLTDAQILEYVEHGFNKCPICSEIDIDVNTPDCEGTTFTQENDCNHCLATWEDSFKLVGIELISGGKLEIKGLNKLQESRYLSHSQACPVCQYNNEEGADLGLNCDEFKTDGNAGSMEVDCPCCKVVWKDIYKLDDVEILDGGKYARVLKTGGSSC
ncbi:TPA: hypothetical protein ACGSTL_001253 [Vibrio parahaemolyticus]|uniref:hypothetical protein n=1 Tax=Vibrio campbellii TaxID=680 RepID=UPI001F0850C4|nr:hypothetical protein [Vibrio campbellii]UMM06671.1 hypothetical protein MKR81_27370 [Vibrio campbellii]